MRQIGATSDSCPFRGALAARRPVCPDGETPSPAKKIELSARLGTNPATLAASRLHRDPALELAAIRRAHVRPRSLYKRGRDAGLRIRRMYQSAQQGTDSSLTRRGWNCGVDAVSSASRTLPFIRARRRAIRFERSRLEFPSAGDGIEREEEDATWRTPSLLGRQSAPEPGPEPEPDPKSEAEPASEPEAEPGAEPEERPKRRRRR